MATMPVTSPSQDVARRLTDDGYVVVTGMMTAEAARNARADLDRVLRTTRTGRNSFEGFDTQRIYALFAKTRVFDALATDPLLLGVLDQVLGHYQLSAPVGICIGPGEKAQILHRDDAIYPVPEPHPPLVVNTMWPLDEFTAENGATRFIPGSHRWEPGRQPGPDDPVEAAVMSPGSALFYLGSLWHGGGVNQTRRPRLGVILEYAAGWLRPQENHCLAVPRDIVRDLPERLQELLGYNIYPPFVGYVDGRHPRRVLSAGPRLPILWPAAGDQVQGPQQAEPAGEGDFRLFIASRSGAGRYPQASGRRLDPVQDQADLHRSTVAGPSGSDIGQLADVTGPPGKGP